VSSVVCRLIGTVVYDFAAHALDVQNAQKRLDRFKDELKKKQKALRKSEMGA
jgi:hypothetical protein